MKDLSALADLPSRDVLLAQIAGLLASPLRTMAGLLKPSAKLRLRPVGLDRAKGGVAAPAEDRSKRSPRLRPGRGSCSGSERRRRDTRRGSRSRGRGPRGRARG